MRWQLKLEFLSYWHVGNGLGEGAKADSIVLKDSSGLPYFPGKALRGLLRNALEKAQKLDWIAQAEHDDTDSSMETDIVTLAFGSSHLDAGANRLTEPGQLFVSNARLPDAERGFLQQSKNTHLLPALFSTMASTAIDEATGSAQQNSLRTFEVTVPLTLYAELTLGAKLNSDQQTELYQAMQLALPLIENIGAKRSRGFGRVQLTLSDVSQVGEPGMSGEVSHAG